MTRRSFARSRESGSAPFFTHLLGLWFGLWIGLGGPSNTALAETPAPALTIAQKAKQHYLKGEAYFKARDFSAAMDEYQRGYEEKPDPIFLFNIAQCHRLLGHVGPAIESYRRYLKAAPEGAGRAVAERQIADLERLLEEEAPPPPPAVGPPEGATASSPAVPATPAATPPPVVTSSDGPGVPPPAAPPPAAPPPATARAPVLAISEAPATPSAAASLGPLGAPSEPATEPVYRRWWFWAAAGAVTAGLLIAVAAASSSGRPACDVGRLCR